MLANLLGKLFRRSVPATAGLGIRLLELVEERGSLVLDAGAMSELGAGRNWVCRAAQFLAWRERLHLLSEPDGALVLLSNSRFDQITRIRGSFSAAAGEADSDLKIAGVENRDNAPAAVPADGDHAYEPVPESAADHDDVIEVEASAASECDWFRLEVAIAEADEDEVDAQMDGLRNFVSLDRRKTPKTGYEPRVDLEEAIPEKKN